MPERQDQQCLIIIDWDDTLLSSSYLATNDIHLDSGPLSDQKMLYELQGLEAAVVNTLTCIMKHGHAVIVTNAEAGWVELSAERFMPKVVPFLEFIPVVSARSQYEPVVGFHPTTWKELAFREAITQVDGPLGCVVSLGDSEHERLALQGTNSSTRPGELFYIKSVKFSERPSITHLQAQLELLEQRFASVIALQRNLDLCVKLRMSNNKMKQMELYLDNVYPSQGHVGSAVGVAVPNGTLSGNWLWTNGVLGGGLGCAVAPSLSPSRSCSSEAKLVVERSCSSEAKDGLVGGELVTCTDLNDEADTGGTGTAAATADGGGGGACGSEDEGRTKAPLLSVAGVQDYITVGGYSVSGST